MLRRFAEYQDLEGAFGRRAMIERAKGMLMERHAIDEAAAFEMMREHSRASNRKLIDLATAVVDGHRLLPKHPERVVRARCRPGIRSLHPSLTARESLAARLNGERSLSEPESDQQCPGG